MPNEECISCKDALEQMKIFSDNRGLDYDSITLSKYLADCLNYAIKKSAIKKSARKKPAMKEIISVPVEELHKWLEGLEKATINNFSRCSTCE